MTEANAPVGTRAPVISSVMAVHTESQVHAYQQVCCSQLFKTGGTPCRHCSAIPVLATSLVTHGCSLRSTLHLYWCAPALWWGPP